MSHKPIIRDAVIEDEPFILNSWLNSFKFSSSFAKGILHEVYYKNHSHIIGKLLASLDNDIKVLCLDDSPDVIIGFFCYSIKNNVAHFMFIKQAFRSMGLAKLLFSESGLNRCSFTHLTNDMHRILSTHKGQFIYNPYLMIGVNNETEDQDIKTSPTSKHSPHSNVNTVGR